MHAASRRALRALRKRQNDFDEMDWEDVPAARVPPKRATRVRVRAPVPPILQYVPRAHRRRVRTTGVGTHVKGPLTPYGGAAAHVSGPALLLAATRR